MNTMRKLKSIYKKICYSVLFLWSYTLLNFNKALAQDKKIDIDIGINKEPVWYQQPWAWIVGAAIFILLLVALLRGGKKK